MVIALPIAVPVLLLTPSVVGEHRPLDRRRRLDLAGAITGTLGLASLLYAVSGAGERGWGAPTTLAPLAAGAALLGGFVAVERRSPAPLVPLAVLRRPRVAVPNAAILLTATTGASTYLLTLYLQRALGRSPLLGIVVQAAGLLVMAGPPASGLAPVLAGSAVWAVGKVLADVAITITATAGVDEGDKGLGAGLVTTSQEVGRALGLGVLTAVATAHAGALADGLRWGLRAGVAFLAAALVVVLAGISPRRRAPAPPARL
jgi:hypothetical protein